MLASISFKFKRKLRLSDLLLCKIPLACKMPLRENKETLVQYSCRYALRGSKIGTD